VDMPESFNRREILKSLSTVPVLGLFGAAVISQNKYRYIDGISSATDIVVEQGSFDNLKGQIPTARIGSLEISRIFLGGNPLKGHAHARDLIYVNHLMKSYMTPARIVKTLRLAEAVGMNTVWLSGGQLDEISRYLAIHKISLQKMVNIYPFNKEKTYREQIDESLERGADIIVICGTSTDRLVQSNEFDTIQNTIDYLRTHNLEAGLAGHSINALIACDEQGVEADFYLKSFHNDNYWSAQPEELRVDFSVDGEKHPDHDRFHDNIFCLYPDKTREWLANLTKPFIAFKVFAGGALDASQAFDWAFGNGADFICGGMHDFQVINNTNIALESLERTTNRERQWYG